MDMSCPPIRLLRAPAESTGEGVGLPPELVAHLERCAPCRAIFDRLAHDGPGTGPMTVPDGPDDHDEEGPPLVPGLVDLRKIGSGGSGVVYRAKRAGLDDWVAVKFLASAPPGGRDRREQAVREAKAAARVRHPNVIRTFDVGLAGGSPYIVMEYFEGGSLHDRLKRRPPLPPEPAARLTLALAEAVAAIHAEGMVHRDLKPSNILLAGPMDAPPWCCTPIVADFGLAREYDGEPLADSHLAAGTPGYMAPEQVLGDHASIGPATDVFALGAVLFRMLAGRPPFIGASAAEIARRTLKPETSPAARFVPGVPPALMAIAATCLRRNSADRYPSADALADDLRRFLEGRPTVRRRPSRVALAAAVLVAALLRGDVAPPAAPAGSVHESLRPALELARLAGLAEKTSLQELATFEGPLREALARVRYEEARSWDSPDIRRDHVDLAWGVGQIVGRRGDEAGQVGLIAEALRASEPPDGRWERESRLRTGTILLALGSRYLSLKQTDRALKAYERCGDLLRPMDDMADARGMTLEAELAVATIPVGSKDTAPRPTLHAVRTRIESALADHPDDGRLLLLLGMACDLEEEPDVAIRAYRRRLELPSFSADNSTRILLAQALLKTKTSPEIIKEECRIRENMTLARWLRSVNGADPDLNSRLQAWDRIGRAVDELTVRADVSVGSFGPRLIAALGTETRNGHAPVDGGRLAEVCDELAAEYAARSSPMTGSGSRRSDLGGLSLEAVRLFEMGLGLAERGDAIASRLKLAEALLTSAPPRRREGDTARALRACELARALLESTPPPPGEAPSVRPRLLAEAWTQTGKALWHDPDRPRTRAALSRALDLARIARDADPEASSAARQCVDRATERLAAFDQEGEGDATAASIMPHRLTLWPTGPQKSPLARGAYRATEVERKAREGGDRVAAAR